MSMSNLTDVVILTDHYDSRGGSGINKITIHHMAGNLTAEQCGYVFQDREASANYGVDSDGRIGCYVEEENRAWSTTDWDNDRQAINIEVANDEIGGDWHVSDTALEKCIELCVDICSRYGFRLDYDGTPNGTLTRHNMFMPTVCPGPYLESQFPYIAEEVNRRLDGDTPAVEGKYRVNSEDGLWLLDEDGEKMEVYSDGTEVEVLGNGYNMYGYHYYKVRVLSDGAEGYMASAFLTKEEEPSPEPTPEPSGDFQVGDRVVVSGYATEDSNGGGERTADYGGNPNDPDDIRYITAINQGAPRPYHISVGNTLGDGDRGWVSADQIRKI